MREQYQAAGLDPADVDPDPIRQFEAWFAEWAATDPFDANAMILATTSPEGRPSARAVLLKGVDERGFVFYTNLASAKARDLAANPTAALCFLWHPVARQVRVTGRAELVPDAEADAYFATRPRGSQLGAWASHQSAVLPDRATLEARVAEFAARFPDEVPRPPHWGGYVVRPDEMEFWQGRPDRLHDRVRYHLVDGVWLRERLSP